MRVPDQISWAQIRRLAMQHKSSLILANILAILATLCSVPIPLLLPLLVDEVLLGQAGIGTDESLAAEYLAAGGGLYWFYAGADLCFAAVFVSF